MLNHDGDPRLGFVRRLNQHHASSRCALALKLCVAGFHRFCLCRVPHLSKAAILPISCVAAMASTDAVTLTASLPQIGFEHVDHVAPC